jgi:hypothetical protein
MWDWDLVIGHYYLLFVFLCYLLFVNCYLYWGLYGDSN